MKYIFFFLILLFCSCNQNVNANTSTINFNISNYDSNTTPYVFIDHELVEVELDSLGSGSINFQSKGSEIVYLKPDITSGLYLYLEPGNTLNIQYDDILIWNGISTVSIDSPKNALNDKFIKYQSKISKKSGNNNPYFNVGVQEFLNLQKKLYLSASDLDDEFKDMFSNYLKHEILHNLYSYPLINYFDYKNRVELNHEYNSFVQKLKNETRENNDLYKQFNVIEEFWFLYYDNSDFENKDLENQLDFLTNSNLESYEKDIIKYNLILGNYNDYGSIGALIKKYPFESTEFSERALRKVNAHLSSISNLDFDSIRLLDVNDNYISLKSIVDDYAYLDFWATWCFPCIAQDSHLEIIAQTDLDNISFAKISLDKDKAKWKKYVAKKDLKNVDNYYLPNGFDSPLAKLWNIKAIPRFMIIDGNIDVIKFSAELPSDATLKDYLKAL